ncbi:MalM family protein [Vibrio methylphosphonaticus]|uniref:MalM family protein n=1 Tax=Vibrio methylphosphonaticus TaxID=2946866 RepID=UPI002029B785|nr:MalM family protein [Vibrio methylphosphonaticus]MCL9774103.1 MalM family protein [Vibrio methylphosphonaticus]
MKLPLLASILLSTVVGCSQIPQHSDVSGTSVLAAAPLCCLDYSELHYQELSHTNELTIELNHRSQAFEFPTGKSFFQAYDLSRFGHIQRFDVYSNIENQVFVPKVQLLNSDYSVIHTSTNDDLILEKQTIFHPDRYHLSVVMNKNEQAEYLVIYTTQASLVEKTSRQLPDSFAAQRSQSIEMQKRVLQPFSIHSAMGKLTLSIDGIEKGLPPKSKSGQVEPVQQAASLPILTVSSFEQYKASLTQRDLNNYGLEIVDLVKQNKFEEALSLVNRATNPAIAKNIFMQSVKLHP